MKVKLLGLLMEPPDEEFLTDISQGLPIRLIPIIDTEKDDDDLESEESKKDFTDEENPLQVKIFSIKPGNGCNFIIHFKVAEVHSYIESGEYTLTFEGQARVCMELPKGMQVVEEISDEESEPPDDNTGSFLDVPNE